MFKFLDKIKYKIVNIRMVRILQVFPRKSRVTEHSVTGVIPIQLYNTAAVNQVCSSGILASWKHKISNTCVHLHEL